MALSQVLAGVLVLRWWDLLGLVALLVPLGRLDLRVGLVLLGRQAQLDLLDLMVLMALQVLVVVLVLQARLVLLVLLDQLDLLALLVLLVLRLLLLVQIIRCNGTTVVALALTVILLMTVQR